MKGLDDPKATFDTAIKAENIKVKVEDIEVKPENIKVEPDIYLNSHSLIQGSKTTKRNVFYNVVSTVEPQPGTHTMYYP